MNNNYLLHDIKMTGFFKFINLTFLVTLLVGCSGSADYSDIMGIPQKIKNVVRDAVDNDYRESVIISLINEKGAHVFHYGSFSNKEDLKYPEKIIFPIASLTKVYTAIVFADLVENSEIGLDDPVNNFTPSAIKMPLIDGQEMTLRHLVTHTSGLPKTIEYFDWNSDDAEMNLFQEAANYSYSKSYGESYRYSNVGMAMLTNILEKKLGKSLHLMMQERVFSPLNMHSTTYDFDQKSRGKVLLQNPGYVPALLRGAGGLYSSVRDINKLLQANMNFSQSDLSPTLNSMLTYNHTNTSDGGGIGFGWKLHNTNNMKIFSHGGQGSDYQIFAGFNKAKGVGVVLMTNSISDDHLKQIAIHILSLGEVPLPNFKNPKEVDVNIEYLKQYVGRYEPVKKGENIVEISVKQGKLFYIETSNKGKVIRRTHIYAKNEKEFFFKEIPVTMTFEVNEDSGKSRLFMHLNEKSIGTLQRD